MRLKSPTVNIRFLRNEFWQPLFELDEFWRKEVGYEVVITSANDSTHLEHSRHYLGEAIDIRTWIAERGGHQLFGTRRETILIESRKIMGKFFQILDEDDHFHIAYIGA